MDDLDRERFATAISAMLVTFGQEATTPRLLGYWLGLKDLSLQQVEMAVAKAMQSATHMPVPADLRAMVAGGSASDRAIAAWNDVQKAAVVSYMKDLDFADWVINAVIRNLGGRWNFFDRLNAGAESEKWLRLDFLKVYATYADALPGEEMVQPLIGQATHGEVCGRFHMPETVCIKGDEQRVAILPPRKYLSIEARQKTQIRVNFKTPYDKSVTNQ